MSLISFTKGLQAGENVVTTWGGFDYLNPVQTMQDGTQADAGGRVATEQIMYTKRDNFPLHVYIMTGGTKHNKTTKQRKERKKKQWLTL